MVGLLSNNQLFIKFYNQIYKNNQNDIDSLLKYIDPFFIDIDDYPKLNDIFELSEKVKRDTYIYNLYDNDNKKHKIFTYTILHLIAKKINSQGGISELFTNVGTSTEITKIIIIIFKKIDIILEDIENLKTQKQNITKFYNELITMKKKVFAFVKFRNDNEASINPRYNKKIIKNQPIYKNSEGKDEYNQYLALRYYNVDGKFGYDANGNYDNFTATSEIQKAASLFSKIPNLGNKSNRKEYYFFGPFDGIFESNLKNKQIAEQSSTLLLDKLIKKDEDMCIIGYGQSGSGKTSTLIYFNKTKEDGILIELCKLPQFTRTFNRIELKMVNLYVYHGTGVNDMSRISSNHYKYNLMEIAGDKAPTFVYVDKRNTWLYEPDIRNKDIPDDKKKGLGLFIDKAFAEREVEPTPNNPNSSRSHVVVCLTLNKSDGSGSRKLVVCDLAGVENVFNCENNDEILKFDDRYTISDMYNKNDENSKEIIFDRYFCDQTGDEAADIKDKKLIDEYNNNIVLTKKYNTLLVPYKKSIEKLDKELNQSGKGGASPLRSPSPTSRSPSPTSRSPSPTSSSQNNTSVQEESTKKTHGCMDATNILKCAKELKYGMVHNGNLDIVIENTNKLENEIKSKFKVIEMIDLISANPAQNAFKDAFRKPYLENYDSLDEVNKMSVDTTLELLDKKRKDLLTDSFRNTNQKLFDDAKKKVLEEMKEKYKELREWVCEYLRFNKLRYNCKLRRNEGYMINKSLKDMRNDIQLLIKKSLSLSEEHKDFLPLFYEKEIYPYCRNINIDDEYFDDFYNFKSDSKLSGILLEIMGGNEDRNFGLDMSSINFVVFTVVNLTDNGKVNNPPNPPFININDIVYYRDIKFDYDKLKESVINILVETKQYQFYMNNNLMVDLFSREKYLNGYDESQLKSYANDIKNVIESNNPSSLIGSLVSTDILLNTNYNKLVCSVNNNLNDILNKYKNMKLDSYITDKLSIEDVKQKIDSTSNFT